MCPTGCDSSRWQRSEPDGKQATLKNRSLHTCSGWSDAKRQPLSFVWGSISRSNTSEGVHPASIPDDKSIKKAVL